MQALAKTAAPLGLACRLRAETAAEHRQLEKAMQFDLHAPDRGQAEKMLTGFYGVLVALEPVLAGQLSEAMAGRSKLALLASNLTDLGYSPERIAALPVAHHAAFLADGHAGAMGAFYVLEGSTLGGKIINKALRRLPDWPLRGRTYFDPYDDETGAMWRQTQQILDDMDEADHDAVVTSARRTFLVLHKWFAP